MKKTKNYSVYLTPETMEKIREYAFKNDTYQNSVIAMAMQSLEEKDAREAEILRQAEEKRNK